MTKRDGHAPGGRRAGKVPSSGSDDAEVIASTGHHRDGRRSGNEAVDEPPPLLGSWRNLYTLLLLELATLIVLFTLLGWWAS